VIVSLNKPRLLYFVYLTVYHNITFLLGLCLICHFQFLAPPLAYVTIHLISLMRTGRFVNAGTGLAIV
jgi:hypothetical protein